MHELKKCNSCGNTFPSSLSFCLNDGSPLVDLESLIGITLDGRYRLDSLIGAGGMGDVYRATHIHLDTQFAVKLLKPELVANQTAIKRFRLEAKAAGRIHHPNAIRVTDFGVTPERIVYLVMEIVEGRSLRDLMNLEGPLPYRRTFNIVRQVCGAVEAAHRGGIIHRDLKPDNINIEKVSSFDRVKVLDFGIAKLKEANPDAYLTQAGTLIGTPQYMSPEQCQGKHLDPRSDIYSIGIILYEMLTGQVPFDGDAPLQVVIKQLHESPTPIQDISRNVPASLAQVVMRCLEKDPERRPSSAAILSDELKRAVEMEDGEIAQSFTDSLVARSRPESSNQIAGPNAATMPEAIGPRPSLDDDQSISPELLSERETTIIPKSRMDTEVVSQEGGLGRITKPEEKARASAGVSNVVTKPQVLPAGNRKRLITTAAAILAGLIGIFLYFSLRPDSRPSGPLEPTPPEGMVYIPGGKYMMGRNDGESDEAPAHEVEVKPFFLDIFEVTNQDYKKFIDATGYRAPKHWKSNGSYAPGEATSPVTYVTWGDAAAYAKWANKRLPTEEEWEYAARGGSKGYLYPWGNQWQEGYADVNRRGQTKPSPVNRFEKDLSPFGIRNLAGNVSEWVQNYYAERYLTKSDQRLRVYRGGNFFELPEKSTTTYRWADYPEDIPDDQMSGVGFRCAKNVE
jgi:eukaryotic-like serine/threonine-protein kinase